MGVSVVGGSYNLRSVLRRRSGEEWTVRPINTQKSEVDNYA